MRFYLSFLLVFICVFATAQVPPMAIGGPQGIDVNRILVRNWLTTPIYADTPSSTLTGSGWPGRGYLITVVKNETPCQSCPPKDTSLWVYTGARWKRVGMDYVTRLVYGGQVSKASGQNLNYIIQPYGAFFDGDYRSSLTNKVATLSPKISDNTGRIDVLVLDRDSFKVKTGIPKITPQKPLVTGSEIEVASFYFRAFDTIPTLNAGSSSVSNIYRVAGIDSIYFTIDTLTFAIKDSIGVAVATNGLTANGKNIKLGGSLTENTNINLSSNELRVLSGSDTARFVNSGGLNLIVKGSSSGQSVINQYYVASTNPSTGRSAYLEPSGSLGLNNGTYDSYLDNLGVTNPLVTLRFPNKPSGDYIIATTSDLSAANGLTKDSTVFRLGGSLNQNTDINLSTRRLTIIGGADTTRFFGDGRVSISGTPDSSNRFFLVNRKSSRLGNLEINVNQSASNTGSGIRIDGVDQTFKFQGSGNAPNAQFQFSNWVNDTTPSGIFGVSKDNIRINLGFAKSIGSSGDTLQGNVFNIMPKYNVSYDSGVTTLRGIYYNPTIQALNKTNHIAYQNTTGSNLLNSSFGNTRIGYSTSDTTFKFDVSGKTRISDTLTLSTTPVTSDTTANDLLVINSSNGQVRRYTGAWPVPSITALNGLTRSNDTISLGGTLNQSTTINGNTNGLTFSNLGVFFANTSTAYIGNPFAEGVGVSSGRARVQKIIGNDVQGLYVSDSIYLQNYNQITEQTSRIKSSTTDTSRFQILTINKTTGSLAAYTAAWPNNGISGSATLDFPSTGHGTSSDLSFTVTGASEGDVVSLGIPNSAMVANVSYTAWVSAADTVTVRLDHYASSGSVDPASATFKVKVFK